MKTKIICTKSPAALGPYSQAIKKDGMLFVSGQIGLDMKTNKIPDDTAGQVRCCLENIKLIITEAGGSMDDVVRCAVYLTDLNEFAAMNEAYAEFFKEPCPARTTIEVSRLPRDVKVEVDAIAML